MTAKEKAQELYKSFICWVVGSNDMEQYIIEYRAKQCALITVNEILEEVPMYKGSIYPKWKFWNEVKNELNKM